MLRTITVASPIDLIREERDNLSGKMDEARNEVLSLEKSLENALGEFSKIYEGVAQYNRWLSNHDSGPESPG